MSRLVVKNWLVFQHYKDRSPPWIKLQKSLLDDFDFATLPLASKALAPMLWLLASETQDGSIDASVAKIAFRLRWPVDDVSTGIKPLIEKGFLCDASGALAGCLQDACVETEAEREAETETEGSSLRSEPISTPVGVECARPADLLGENIEAPTIIAKPKKPKAPKDRATKTAWDGEWPQIGATAPYRMPNRIGDGPQEFMDYQKSGLPEDQFDTVVQAFRDHHAAKGSQFVDWFAAFRTWIRNETKFRQRPEQSRPFDRSTNFARH